MRPNVPWPLFILLNTESARDTAVDSFACVPFTSSVSLRSDAVACIRSRAAICELLTICCSSPRLVAESTRDEK